MDKTRMSHTVIKVWNLEESRQFYRKLCGFMGLKLIRSSKSSFAYYNENFSIWVSKATKKAHFSRGNSGYDHVAFSASSRKQVDELQKMLKKEKARILYPAEEHSEFAPGYYSISFFDPDGTIMEFLYLPDGKNSYG